VQFVISTLMLLLAELEERALDPEAVAEVVAKLRQALIALRNSPIAKLGLPLELELERIVSVRTAALLRDVSMDSIVRHFGDHIVRTGGKIRGLKLKHVLDLAPETPRLPQPRRKKHALVPPRRRRFGQGAKITETDNAEGKAAS
jgi:hypothetical protein